MTPFLHLRAYSQLHEAYHFLITSIQVRLCLCVVLMSINYDPITFPNWYSVAHVETISIHSHSLSLIRTLYSLKKIKNRTYFCTDAPISYFIS